LRQHGCGPRRSDQSCRRGRRRMGGVKLLDWSGKQGHSDRCELSTNAWGQTMIWARYFPREGFSLIVIGFVTSAVTHMCSAPAVAHDQWSDGSSIPAWVSNYCCGVADAHRLTVKQIYRVEGGWRADGYAHTIPDDRVLPSEDGYVWLFYRNYENGYQSTPFCFFLPQGST